MLDDGDHEIGQGLPLYQQKDRLLQREPLILYAAILKLAPQLRKIRRLGVLGVDENSARAVHPRSSRLTIGTPLPFLSFVVCCGGCARNLPTTRTRTNKKTQYHESRPKKGNATLRRTKRKGHPNSE